MKHRNALETWSATPVTLASSGTYDFTNAITKAYGSNLVFLGGTFYGIYSGDITNGVTPGVQDGIINEADFLELENSLNLFLTGYNIHDFNR
ncbi:MAG: hypothetical protein IPP51_03435 [Bacteroidetes bacterium]|nr:hypothetical protein [Bacteroidota bacterium]